MELKDKAREILAHLIRNRFDGLDAHGMINTAPSLINIAREAGLNKLADEMISDLKAELPPKALEVTLRDIA